jgi:hypothetical protein
MGRDLTYPPSLERRTAGREGWSTSSWRPEARPFHELLARPRRLMLGGLCHAAIGVGPLDEKRIHHYSPPNRIDCAVTQTETTL